MLGLVLVALLPLAGAICGLKPQVMADVDDAILHPSEFGVGFMGIDESFEESTGNIEQVPNPGAGQFLRELSRGPLELPNPEGIVILSARPNTGNFGKFLDDACHIFPPLWFGCQQLKNLVNDMFPNLVDQEINSVGSTVKAELGSPASDFLVTSFQDLWQKFADRKVINQAAFRAQNPGLFKYILVDDNANGGHVGAATMLNDPNSCVAVAFIHDVVHSPKNFINRPNPIHPLTGRIDPIPMPANLVPVQNDPNRYVLYRNFAHASVLALQKGYISLAGKNRIVNAIKATQIYKNCVKQATDPDCTPGSDEDDCDPGCAELRADVAAAAIFILHREAAVQDVDDFTTAPCQCTAWSQWTSCTSSTGVSTRTCLTNPNCVQTRRCSCKDCPAWSDWDKCLSLTDSSIRTCPQRGFSNCFEQRPCTCDDCKEYTPWSSCVNGIKTRKCTHIPECIQRAECTCDDCDKWEDTTKCTKPGDVVVQQCKTVGLEKCLKRRTCDCTDCALWSDPNPSKCTKGPGECLDIQCKTPGFEECKSRIVCTCDDCPEWSDWTPCNGLGTISEKRCKTPGWEQCSERKQCPADDITSKQKHAETQDIDDLAIAAPCICSSWSRWTPCDSITGISTRTCFSNPNCVQRRRCTCDDCPTWSDWDKCLSLTDSSVRKCTNPRFPNCVEQKPCTCEDCLEYTPWSPCVNGVSTRQCTHISGCVQTQTCVVPCSLCTQWADITKCSGPGSVVIQQCQNTGLEQCQRRRLCSCADCPEWSDWTLCSVFGGTATRRCKTTGWENCLASRPCPEIGVNGEVLGHKKNIHAEAQAEDVDTQVEIRPPMSHQAMPPRGQASSIKGQQIMFAGAALAAFLALSVFIMFAVVRRSRRHQPLHAQEPGLRGDIL